MADVKKLATREGYGKALIELGNINKNIVVLDADLSAATKTNGFAKAHSKRFINVGIAEQNLMCVAAGIAATGKTVFASSFAMFAAGRAFEQVRNSIAYPRLNVKIGATHAGLSVGEDGASHQCNEDIALMRTLPGMIIINPADSMEAEAAVFAAAKIDGPVYLRFGRLAVPNLSDDTSYFTIGKGVVLKPGTDVTLIATGLMVERALEACKMLAAENISARVINIHTIKPLDEELIIAAASETGAIVTAEEHSIIGGLGSAVAECLSATRPTPVLRVGVEDVFGKSGPGADVLDHFGLNSLNIVAKAKQAIALK